MLLLLKLLKSRSKATGTGGPGDVWVYKSTGRPFSSVACLSGRNTPPPSSASNQRSEAAHIRPTMDPGLPWKSRGRTEIREWTMLQSGLVSHA
jgi:hypothetical protein